MVKKLLDYWIQVTACLIAIAVIITLHSYPPQPVPLPKPVNELSLADEAEMEELINTLDWSDPNVCNNPRVIKYALCDDLVSTTSMDDVFEN